LAGLMGLLMRRRPESVPAAAQPTGRERTYRAGPTTTTETDATKRRAEESDAARRLRESQHGQPQGPYTGQTPHTGRYGEPSNEQPPANEAEYPTRGQPGQYPGGNQPPNR